MDVVLKNRRYYKVALQIGTSRKLFHLSSSKCKSINLINTTLKIMKHIRSININ